MYAETFGISGASPEAELCAQWVQWANAGIMSGAIENEDSIRYNLNAFWTEKTSAYANEDAQGQANLDRLDTFAHGIWNALESGKMVSASPSYWDFWKSYIGGGTPARPEAYQAASAAASASAGEAAAASRTGGAFGAGMTKLATSQGAAIKNELAQSNGSWAQPGIANLGGIPWWAWVGGAMAILLLMRAKK